MTTDEFLALRPGDIIRSVSNTHWLIVVDGPSQYPHNMKSKDYKEFNVVYREDPAPGHVFDTTILDSFIDMNRDRTRGLYDVELSSSWANYFKRVEMPK